LLDESEWVGRENLDPVHVARYDAKEDAEAAAEVQLLRELGLAHDSVVVDLGAGTGQFAVAAAGVCSRVIAVDVSPAMLRRLEANVKAAGVTNVAIVNAGFLTYAHQGAPVDVVYSRYALHHLPDFWKGIALQRMHAVLRVGGILRLWDVVFSFDPSAATDRIEAWCATSGTDVGSDWIRDELEEHVRTEHSTFSWLLEPMLVRTGFDVVQAVYSDDGIVARYVARAR
jgi:ubiquinone/menaquinone biosynthesis C-methylase UbiE